MIISKTIKRKLLVAFNRYGFIILILLSPMVRLKGQETNSSTTTDTIWIKGGNYVLLENQILHFPKDTFLVLPHGAKILIQKDISSESPGFYDTLKNKAAQRTWTRLIHELLFVESKQAQSENQGNLKSEDQYLEHKGKVIRNILLIGTDIFGPTVIDTTVTSTTWIGSTLNRIHFYTNEKIIRNNLVFKKGDSIDPLLLADNERIIRKLKFIYDARIQVMPVSEDYVDVYVITKDVYSFGFGMDFDGVEPSVIELYNRNLFGFGHEIYGTLNFDYKPEQAEDYDTVSPLGWQAHYRISNIAGTFIRSELRYLNSDFHKFYGVRLYRSFITPRTKYAGGVHVSYESKLIRTDTIGWFKNNYQDYWLGRSFLIDPDERKRIILAGRFIHNNVVKRPGIPDNAYHDLQKYRLFFASLAYSKQNFYESNLIYNYGRTEDIPYGSLIEVTGGYEKNEFGNRLYTSLQLSGGNFFDNFGYLQSSFAIGGFVSAGSYQQGMIQVRVNYFTDAFPLRKSVFRQFVDIDYTIGIRPYLDEEICISNNKGIRGLFGEELCGTHRLAMNLESIAFTPLSIFGFRFAFYGFADLAFIGPYDRGILTNRLYSGLGFGVRIRNENLVFKTFQIRFAFYPALPSQFSPSLFTISGEKLLNPRDFDFIGPQSLPFR